MDEKQTNKRTQQIDSRAILSSKERTSCLSTVEFLWRHKDEPLRFFYVTMLGIETGSHLCALETMYFVDEELTKNEW